MIYIPNLTVMVTKYVFPLFLLFSLSTYCSGQVIGDFENWNSIGEHIYQPELSNFWNVQNPEAGIPLEWGAFLKPGVTRTTDAYQDDYAIVLHNWYFYINEEIRYKSSIQAFPQTISGYYKFIRDEIMLDSIQGYGSVQVTNADGEVIGEVVMNFDTSSTYQYFEFEIPQLSDQAVDSVEVIFKNTEDMNFCENDACNLLYLDQISLNYATNTSTQSKDELSVYPNPATTLLFIDMPKGVQQSIEILDLQGRRIEVEKLGSNLDISYLKAGIYTIKLLSEDKLMTAKFIKL